jgi:hypothetical protein
MKVNLKMAIKMVKESKLTLMDHNMKVNGKMTKEMVKES